MKLLIALLLSFPLFSQESTIYTFRVPGNLASGLYGAPPAQFDTVCIFVRPNKENIKWIAAEGSIFVGKDEYKFDQVNLNLNKLGAVFTVFIPSTSSQIRIERKITEISVPENAAPVVVEVK